ncbi:uncharacterized protein LOC124377322 [Silurus meridionalis]|uniref:uncharacterized protein LOC124377322 n=1 Tax=Silurus meridionalis TaxID=175797 RepID=UPI001EEC7DEA|nr:uncharacterized protein LOC124377322 [Silurus meridionalis]
MSEAPPQSQSDGDVTVLTLSITGKIAFSRVGNPLGAVSLRKVVTTDASLAVSSESPRIGQIRQYDGGGAYKSPGRNALSSTSPSSEISWCGAWSISCRCGDSCAGNVECGRISCPGKSLYGECPPVAKRSALRISSSKFDRADSTKSKRRRSLCHTNRSQLARESVADGDFPTPARSTLASPVAQGSPLASARRDFSPGTGQSSSLGLARERMNLSVAGLPPKVIETIQNARAASTRSAYDRKWSVFELWCAQRHIIPFHCSVADVLCFLQELLDKGRAFSTVKVYLAAVSACHIGIDGNTIGHHPLVCRFMKGARRLSTFSKPLVPPWDLSVVLSALSQSPFEPIESIDLKLLSLKVALLLALSTAKRVSELHALSVHISCMRFASDFSRVALKTNPAFIPKVCESAFACRQVDLVAFHPPPFSSAEEERLHCLCPVRALRHYVDRTEGLRRSNQLFVSWVDSRKGSPVSRQRLSHWLVEAIIMCYNSVGLNPPEGLRAHSTRGLATVGAFKGVSIQDICAAACWASPHTFVRFYRLDVTEPSLAHSVLSV